MEKDKIKDKLLNLFTKIDYNQEKRVLKDFVIFQDEVRFEDKTVLPLVDKKAHIPIDDKSTFEIDFENVDLVLKEIKAILDIT